MPRARFTVAPPRAKLAPCAPGSRPCPQAPRGPLPSAPSILAGLRGLPPPPRSSARCPFPSPAPWAPSPRLCPLSSFIWSRCWPECPSTSVQSDLLFAPLLTWRPAALRSWCLLPLLPPPPTPPTPLNRQNLGDLLSLNLKVNQKPQEPNGFSPETRSLRGKRREPPTPLGGWHGEPGQESLCEGAPSV